MWNTRVRRWLGIPAVFLVTGPPAGGLVLTLCMTLVAGPGVVLGLPIALVMSYPFGGVQAALAGLVAAATLRPGGGVRARPPVLAGAVLGLLAGALAAVAQEEATPEVGWPSRAEIAMAGVASGTAMLLVHLAGAVAGVVACRWLERRPGGSAGQRRPVGGHSGGL